MPHLGLHQLCFPEDKMYRVHSWAASLGILILLLQLISIKKLFNDIAEQGDHLTSLVLFILKANLEKRIS